MKKHFYLYPVPLTPLSKKHSEPLSTIVYNIFLPKKKKKHIGPFLSIVLLKILIPFKILYWVWFNLCFFLWLIFQLSIYCFSYVSSKLEK